MIDKTLYTEENLHKQGVHGGIEKAVPNLTLSKTEKHTSLYLAYESQLLGNTGSKQKISKRYIACPLLDCDKNPTCPMEEQCQLLFEFTGKEIKVFLFRKRRKIKHSSDMVYPYIL